MELSRSVPSRVGRPATPTNPLTRGTIALLATSIVMLGASTWLGAVYLAAADPCALPSGAASLDEPAQVELARHAMACRDLENGRITLDDYRALIGVAIAPPAAPEPPQVMWASSVRAVSSEYSADQWSAKQALGAPDVYPNSGDLPHAWASLTPDAPWEFIEVGFPTPQKIRGVVVYETLAPGAISEVEIITASGARKVVYQQEHVDAAPTGAQITPFAFLCSDEPVVAARVRLASGQVPGWNEIDAIGALPCR